MWLARPRGIVGTMKTNALALLFLSSALLGCGPAQGVSPALQADLATILDRVVEKKSAPGVALHITADGESWSGAAGVASVDTGAAMAPEARFRAGSLAKVFVATAVLQAAERGKLGLEDPLTRWLPAAVTGQIAGAEAITLRMLLSHRSGIPEWVDDGMRQVVGEQPAKVWTLDEILARAAAKERPFPPGGGYAYSNTNYNLLGEILGAAYGQSWREVVRTQVIARAGLTATALPEEGDLECGDGCASGYQAIAGALVDLTRVDPSMAGAGGGHAFVTSTADLTRFFQALRGGALFDDPATLEAMFTFQPAAEPQMKQVGYGLGVAENEVNGLVVQGHLGGTAGYHSFMIYVPATDRYLSGVANLTGGAGAVLLPVLQRVARP